MKWSDKETYQFVKIYFAHEHLWNTKHVAYKSNERRLMSYKQVIAEFKESTGIALTLNEARVKIKNLKSTYSQELNKIRVRSAPDYTYKPAMRWFSVWHMNIQNARKRARGLAEDSNMTDEECEKTWLSNETDDNDISIDPFQSHNDDYLIIMKPEPKNTQSNGNVPTLRSVNRKEFDHSSSVDTSISTVRGSLDSSLDLMKEDEFDIYGKYIASQLRNMDLQRALTLQLEIQGLVSEARLADLSYKSNH